MRSVELEPPKRRKDLTSRAAVAVKERMKDTTPLMRAVVDEDEERVRKMLDLYWNAVREASERGEQPSLEGDELFARDKSGCTALDWARRRGLKRIEGMVGEAVRQRMQLEAERGTAASTTATLGWMRVANEKLASSVQSALELEDGEEFVKTLDDVLEKLAPTHPTPHPRRPAKDLIPLPRVDFERAILMERRAIQDEEELEAGAGGGKKVGLEGGRVSEKLVEVEGTTGSGASATLAVGTASTLLSERAKSHRRAMAWKQHHPLARSLPPGLRGAIESAARGPDSFWIDRQYGSGFNALARAASQQAFRLVVRLLELGADPNVELSSGRSPLDFACASNEVEVVGAMFLFGGDPVRVSMKTGQSSLHAAAGAGADVSVQLVLQRVYEEALNRLKGTAAETNFFAPPQHWSQAFLDFLVHKDQEGRTALDHARDEGHGEVVELLEGEIERTESLLHRWASEKAATQYVSCPQCNERVVRAELDRHVRYLCALRPPEWRDKFHAAPSAGDEPTGYAKALAARARRRVLAMRASVGHAIIPSADLPPIETLSHLPTADPGSQTRYERDVARRLVVPRPSDRELLSFEQVLARHHRGAPVDPVASSPPSPHSPPHPTPSSPPPPPPPSSPPFSPSSPPAPSSPSSSSSLTPCPLGCGLKFPEAHLAVHIGSRCVKRIISCPNGCGDRIEVAEMFLHEHECPNAPIRCACGQILNRNEHAEHTKKGCLEAMVFCPLGCGRKVRRNHVHQHTRFECGKRDRMCPECGVVVAVDAIPRHLATDCMRVFVPCPRCACSVAREYMEEHLAKCKERPVKCPACHTTVALDDLDDHLYRVCEASTQACPLGCGAMVSRKRVMHQVPHSPHPGAKSDDGSGGELVGTTDPIAAQRMVRQAGEDVTWQHVKDGEVGEVVFESEEDRHVQLECPRRVMPCRRCGDSVHACEMERHLVDLCRKRLVPCPFGCGESALSTELETHKLKCFYQPISCEVNSPRCIRQLRSWVLGDWRAGKGVLARCVDHGSNPLIWCAKVDDAPRSRLLLSLLQDSEVNVESAQGQTGLTAAANAGNVRAVLSFLDAGADINHITRRGLTPLLAASIANQVDVVDVLLERGADPSIRTTLRTTALQRARLLGAHAAADRIAELDLAKESQHHVFHGILRGDLLLVGRTLHDEYVLRRDRITRRRNLRKLQAALAASKSAEGGGGDGGGGGEGGGDEEEEKEEGGDDEEGAGSGELAVVVAGEKKDGGMRRIVEDDDKVVVTYRPGVLEVMRARRRALVRAVVREQRSACRILSIIVASSPMFQRFRVAADRSIPVTTVESIPGASIGMEPSMLSLDPSFLDVPDGAAGAEASRSVTRGPHAMMRTKERRRLARQRRKLASEGMLHVQSKASLGVLAKELIKVGGRYGRGKMQHEKVHNALINARVLHSTSLTGHSPMSFAATVGDVAMVKLLLRVGASPEYSEGFLSTCARVIQLAYRQYFERKYASAEDVLALASAETRDEVEAAARLERRIKFFADSLALQQRIRTMRLARRQERVPLIEALYSGKIEVAKVLLKAGARIWCASHVLPSTPPPFAITRPLQVDAEVTKTGRVVVKGLGIVVPRLDETGTAIHPSDDVLMHHDEVEEEETGGTTKAHKKRYSDTKWYVHPVTGVLTLYEKPEVDGSFTLSEGDDFIQQLPLPLYATEAASLGYERLGHRSFLWSKGWSRSDPHTQCIVLALRETRDVALRRFSAHAQVKHDRHRRRRAKRLQAVALRMEKAMDQFDSVASLACLQAGLPAQYEGKNGHTALTVASKTEAVVQAPDTASAHIRGRRMLALVVILESYTTLPRDLLCHEPALGAAALHVAAFHGRLGAIRALISRGANVNQQSTGGALGRMDESRADVVAEQHSEFLVPWEELVGRTPLMFAAMSGKRAAVRLLLQLGADPLLEDAQGLTADQIALAKDYTRVASIIAHHAHGHSSADSGTEDVSREGLRTELCRWGCGARYFIGTQALHESACPRVPVPCPLDCGEELWRADVSNHIRTECSCRRMRCPTKSCSVVVIAGSLKEHLAPGGDCMAPLPHRESALRTIEESKLRTLSRATVSHDEEERL